jgi:hypothetical protein
MSHSCPTPEGTLATVITIRAKNVRSLCFQEDALVDWVSGGRAFALDGTERRARINFGYRFDAAVSSEDGLYAVIYERLGTKALLVDSAGRLLRELNRSFYCADAYEYPAHLFRLPGGRHVVAHCPEEYNRIEIDDVATGRRLTESTVRKPEDFFHSRLASNPSATRLLSAGWVWHPWDAMLHFDVAASLSDPTHLDSLTWSAPSGPNVDLAGESSACWLSDELVAVGGSAEGENPKAPTEEGGSARLRPSGLAVFDVLLRRYIRSFRLSNPPGTMMRVGDDHVVSFYRYPKLISLLTGEIVQAWEDLATGMQTSSVCQDVIESVPPMALDPVRRRFAVADPEAIHVVVLDPRA